MSPLLFQTIQNFFTPLISSVLLIIFLFATQSLQKDVLKRFKLAAFSVFFLVIADGVQFYCEGLTYVTSVRMWAAAFGYLLRPAILYYVLMIFLRRKSDRFRYLMAIPLVLTAICAFAAFFTEKSFYYTAENVLVRGPLISMPFIASFFYCIAIIIESVRNIRVGDIKETIIILIILVIDGVATYLEAVWRFGGLLSGFCTVGIIFYYLFFMIDDYTHDQLTYAYRRERLYRDFDKKTSVYGVIAFDINDLKKINDTRGHAEGDKAITTVSRAVENCLPQEARLYRLGGDEFVVMLTADTIGYVNAIECKIRDAVSHTDYSIAIGSVLREESESLESAMSRADEIMYKEKRARKGIQVDY